MLAASGGHLSIVRLLKEKEMGLKMENGGNALIPAAMQGHSEVVSELLGEVGAVLLGKTALMYAASACRLDVVRILAPLECGKVESNGLTALLLAIQTGNVPICTVLAEFEAEITGKDGWTPLMSAAQARCVDVAKLFLN